MSYNKEIMDKKLKAFLSENKTVTDLYVYYGPADKTRIDKVRASTPKNNCLLYILSEGHITSGDMHEDNSVLISDCDNVEHDIWLIISVLGCSNLTFSSEKPGNKAELIKTSEIKRTVENALLNWMHFSSSIMIKLRCSLLNLPLIINGLSLKVSQAEDIPAVICGAGPSLIKQIELLKANVSKIFIITAGRVGSLLIKHGIIPDVMVQVDPETDYDSHSGTTPESILAAICNVSHNSALSFPKIVWANGDSSYFNKLMTDAGIVSNKIEMSKTSTVTAIDFAVKSGFRKIALIGNDHCLSESKALHAEGYIDDGIYGVYELAVKGNDEDEVPSTPELTILRNGIEKYLEKLSEQEGLRVFNCTLGGAKINFTERTSFELFISSTKSSAKENLILKQLEQNPDCIEKLRQGAHELDRFIELSKENITCTENIIQLCRNASSDPWELTMLKQMNEMLINRENYLLAKPIAGTLISAVKDQCDLIITEPLSECGPNDLNFLNYKKKKYQFILDLSMDIKQDLDYALSDDTVNKIKSRETSSLKGRRNPLSFKSFRNFAIDFIRKSNPKFADLLNSGYFDKYKTGFEFTNNWQNIPYVRKLISGTLAAPLSADYLHMDKIAEKEVADFIKSTNFDNAKNAVVFFAPGNWLHPVIFSQQFANADIAVIDPWPVVLSEIINCSIFTNHLSENTVIIGIDDELKNIWEIYTSFKNRMRQSEKQILFFKHPQTWKFPEIRSLVQLFK